MIIMRLQLLLSPTSVATNLDGGATAGPHLMERFAMTECYSAGRTRCGASPMDLISTQEYSPPSSALSMRSPGASLGGMRTRTSPVGFLCTRTMSSCRQREHNLILVKCLGCCNPTQCNERPCSRDLGVIPRHVLLRD